MEWNWIMLVTVFDTEENVQATIPYGMFNSDTAALKACQESRVQDKFPEAGSFSFEVKQVRQPE